MFNIRKGFTLIELLIVMAVIAVLIGIAIPSFRGMQSQAKTAKAQGDMRVLKLAVEA
jgi:prepilin-type N-terminal cleavage/methylation domain-containing protein